MDGVLAASGAASAGVLVERFAMTGSLGAGRASDRRQNLMSRSSIAQKGGPRKDETGSGVERGTPALMGLGNKPMEGV
jgi:hypothetical protein